MKMIQWRKYDALAVCDFPVGIFHMGDNSRMVFDNMTVAVNNSGCQ
jgi:hypothetical protein